MSATLTAEIREAVVYSAKNWPKTLDAQGLLGELDALARRVQTLVGTADEDLLKAANSFLAQWRIVLPHIAAASILSVVHGAKYDGPTINQQIDALAAAVAKAEGR